MERFFFSDTFLFEHACLEWIASSVHLVHVVVIGAFYGPDATSLLSGPGQPYYLPVSGLACLNNCLILDIVGKTDRFNQIL